MATVKKNITVDEDVLKDFLEIAEYKGIKVSTWISQQMKRFVEEEKPKLEKLKKK